MLIAQVGSFIGLGFLALAVHRAGLPRSLRAVGAFFWGAADAVECWKAGFRHSMIKARELEEKQA